MTEAQFELLILIAKKHTNIHDDLDRKIQEQIDRCEIEWKFKDMDED